MSAPNIRRGRPDRRRDPERTATLYQDYIDGMSIADISRKWGVSRTTIYRRFELYGLQRRSTGCTVSTKGVPFGEHANTARSRLTGLRRSTAARATLRDHHNLSGPDRAVLRLQADHPDLSLSELGARCQPPMTKFAYAAKLRRALARHRQ
jgi:transposase-like protein